MRVEVNADNLMCATCGELMYRRPYNCVHSLENTHVSAYVEVPDPAPVQAQEWEHTYIPLTGPTWETLIVGLDMGSEIVLGPVLADGLNYVVLRRPRRNDAPQGEEVAG